MPDTPPTGRRLWAALAALALLACVLRLGGTTYWQDEGLVAFLGETVLHSGVPMAWDGHNLAHDLNYTRLYNEDFVWVGHPWLPFYLAALGQAIGGPGPWAGRLPFALAGWLALVLLYPAGCAVLGSRRAAMWALVAGVASVPCYLYVRQCQYYPLLLLGTVLVWWGLASIAEHRRAFYFILVGLLLLAHSNPVSLCGVAVPCVVATARQWRQPRVALRYVAAGACAALFTIPFVWYARSWQALGSYQATTLGFGLRAPLQAWRFLWEANLWVFPVAGVPLLAWAAWPRSPGTAATESTADPRAVRHLTLDAVLVLVVTAMVSPWPFFRYVMPLFPLGFWLTGSILARAQARHGVLAAVLAVTLLGTRAWSVLGHRTTACVLDRVAPAGLTRAALARLEPYALGLSADQAGFVYELTHPYQGPVDALLRFFATHARPNETLAITYPQEPLAHLTPLHLVGRIPPDWPEAQRLPAYISHVGQPDWIVVRAQYPNALFDAEAFFGAFGDAYTEHVLPEADVTWNNRPYPLAHRFRTPVDGPRLVVYERRRPAGANTHASSTKQPLNVNPSPQRTTAGR